MLLLPASGMVVISSALSASSECSTRARMASTVKLSALAGLAGFFAALVGLAAVVLAGPLVDRAMLRTPSLAFVTRNRLAERGGGADARRRGRVQSCVQEHPARRIEVGQLGGPPLHDAKPVEPMGCDARQGPQTIGRACEHRNGHGLEDPVPALPTADLAQIVGAHQPDEPDMREHPRQATQRVRR